MYSSSKDIGGNPVREFRAPGRGGETVTPLTEKKHESITPPKMTQGIPVTRASTLRGAEVVGLFQRVKSS